MKKIKVAIVGCGNCAKALVEGTQYYIDNPEDEVGLTYQDIGGYTVNDIEFVIGFDVDKRKINTPLRDALRAAPNCAMEHSPHMRDVVPADAYCLYGPVLDGVADYMLSFPEEISFRLDEDAEPLTAEEVEQLLRTLEVDILINYLPVGATEASDWYIQRALASGCHVVNCMPTFIATSSARRLEQQFIDAGLTIVGSDMRSAFGASRLSEVLQGALIDSGLMVTQHIQENKACGSTQGQEHMRTGRSANTDFLNMAKQERLKDKHVSKENVLKGQNAVREVGIEGMTLYAGPSLTVMQKPGGLYIGSDNKVATFDIVAYGWAGARYELTARLSVQDSPNSGGVVIDAIRFCRVAAEMGVVGYLRGASAWTQKSPPVQMRTSDAKYECDMLANRQLTDLTEAQLKENSPKAKNLPYSNQKSKTDYV